jgi:hypothetical protein
MEEVAKKKELSAPRFHLTDEEMGVFYRLLETKTYMAACLEMKMDRWYSKNSLIPTAQKMVNMVRQDPEKYKVHPDSIVRIEHAIRERDVNRKTRETALEKNLATENQNFKNILEDTRAGLLDILSRKVKRIGRSNKKIDEMNLGTLATTLAIIIDKTQLIRGEATENVAVLAKIDQNISPEAALDMILRMRETNLESKNNKK